jgi:hypothetical protein
MEWGLDIAVGSACVSQPAVENRRPGIGMAVRAGAVTFGGQALLSAAATASLAELGLAARRHRRPKGWAVLGVAALAICRVGLSPWMRGWGAFFVEAAAGGRTRLTARGRIPRGMAALTYAALLEVPHFIMQRKMLLGIKARAEAPAIATAAGP